MSRRVDGDDDSPSLRASPDRGVAAGEVLMMGWGFDMQGWDGHWFGGGLMFVFWIAVIVGIVLLLRGLASRPGAGGQAEGRETPLEILQRRYAKGEIDTAEFEEKKKALRE